MNENDNKVVPEKRTYINVQYDRKVSAKALGAIFDKETKKWYHTEQDKDKASRFFEHGFYLWREYLDVPYADKDEAKSIGAKFNRNVKQWYIDDPHLLPLVDKWIIKQTETLKQKDIDLNAPREYINVPYSKKELAKSLGANFDPDAKCWFHVDLTSEGRKKFREAGFYKYKKTLNVPSKEIAEAKKAGVKFNSWDKSWYIDDPRIADATKKWEFAPVEPVSDVSHSVINNQDNQIPVVASSVGIESGTVVIASELEDIDTSDINLDDMPF